MEQKQDLRRHDSAGISHAVAHYLMAIDTLTEKGEAPRAADVARMLDISRNAVSLKLQSLRDSGLVEQSEDHRLHLSDKGRFEVENIVSMRRAVHFFLKDFLEVPPEQAIEDACQVEHLLSKESGEKLLKLFLFLQSKDPTIAQFLQSFKDYALKCDGDTNCQICHHRCYLDTSQTESAS